MSMLKRRNQTLRGLWWAAVAVLAGFSLEARPLAAFDNGLRDVPELEDKAALLKELGYEGIVWRPGRTGEMLAILDRHGLKMAGTYVVLTGTSNACPVPADVALEINALKGRDTLVWLSIKGQTTDEVAVEGIRQVTALAATNGLRVALYPHVGCHTDTTASVLRLMRQAGVTNLGVSFNLCHFLRQEDEANLETTLRELAPHLWLVSLHGADRGDTRSMGWDRLIRPLGEGSFETRKLLRLLDDIGYRGPVALQCFQIEQPAREHLEKSMQAWRGLTGPAVPSSGGALR